MKGLSGPRFLAVIVVDLVWLMVVAELGGLAGFGFLFAGIALLGIGAFRWGYDSRDGANWTSGRGLRGSEPVFDSRYVDGQIARLERQFPPSAT